MVYSSKTTTTIWKKKSFYTKQNHHSTHFVVLVLIFKGYANTKFLSEFLPRKNCVGLFCAIYNCWSSLQILCSSLILSVCVRDSCSAVAFSAVITGLRSIFSFVYLAWFTFINCTHVHVQVHCIKHTNAACVVYFVSNRFSASVVDGHTTVHASTKFNRWVSSVVVVGWRIQNCVHETVIA